VCRIRVRITALDRREQSKNVHALIVTSNLGLVKLAEKFGDAVASRAGGDVQSAAVSGSGSAARVGREGIPAAAE
jgi:hypothetical protein